MYNKTACGSYLSRGSCCSQTALMLPIRQALEEIPYCCSVSVIFLSQAHFVRLYRYIAIGVQRG